jgi:S1-C subfamily serine protease
MKRVRAIIAVIAFVVATVPAFTFSAWNPVAEKVQKSLALLMVGEEGACTAFSINEKEDYVLTANHCFGRDIEGKDLLVDNTPAKLVARDQKRDLMVLYVKGLDKSAIHMATADPKVGDEMASYGYGYALSKPLFRITHASAIDTDEAPKMVITDTDFTPGQSGGPVVNPDGDLVMIVQAGDGHGLGIGRGVEDIKKSMGRYFEEKK